MNRFTYKDLEKHCSDLNEKMASKDIHWVLVPGKRYGYTALGCATTEQAARHTEQAARHTVNRTVKTCATPKQCADAANEFVLNKLLEL